MEGIKRVADKTVKYWFSLKGGTHIPVFENQTKEEAFNSFIEKQKSREKESFDPKTFNADDWASSIKDPKCTSDEKGFNYMLSQMKDPDLKQKIAEVEKKNEGLTSTHDMHWLSGEGAGAVYDDERTRLHDKIISDYLEENKQAVCKDGETPTLILLGGRGGSGKSKFDGLVYDRSKYLVVDSDDIKSKLPEYKGWNASQVHEESSVIMKKLLRYARGLNMNVVIDGTMSSYKSYEKYFNQFKGYKTEAHYMFLPPQESVKRAMGRFSNGKKYDGRFVPAKILMNMNDNEKVFDKVKTRCDKWSFYSNYGVAKDAKPDLICSKN